MSDDFNEQLAIKITDLIPPRKGAQALAKEIYASLGFGKANSAYQFINHARKGYLEPGGSLDILPSRVAVLLSSLGVPTEDPIIAAARKYYTSENGFPLFIYPPLSLAGYFPLTKQEVKVVSDLITSRLENIVNTEDAEAGVLNDLWSKLHHEVHPLCKK